MTNAEIDKLAAEVVGFTCLDKEGAEPPLGALIGAAMLRDSEAVYDKWRCLEGAWAHGVRVYCALVWDIAEIAKGRKA